MNNTTLNGNGTHGHKVGRPRLVTRDVVRKVMRTAREKGISERAAALALGLVPITVAVNKARLGLTNKRTENA